MNLNVGGISTEGALRTFLLLRSSFFGAWVVWWSYTCYFCVRCLFYNSLKETCYTLLCFPIGAVFSYLLQACPWMCFFKFRFFRRLIQYLVALIFSVFKWGRLYTCVRMSGSFHALYAACIQLGGMIRLRADNEHQRGVIEPFWSVSMFRK